MMKPPKSLSIAIIAAWSGFHPLAHGAETENDRFARIVLITPEEANAPEGYKVRLDSLAKRVELFLEEWMAHWETPIERSEIFARNEDGSVAVTLVRSKVLNPKGRAALPDLRKHAIEGASKQLGVPARDGAPVIWWIFYDYPEVKGVIF